MEMRSESYLLLGRKYKSLRGSDTSQAFTVNWLCMSNITIERSPVGLSDAYFLAWFATAAIRFEISSGSPMK